MYFHVFACISIYFNVFACISMYVIIFMYLHIYQCISMYFHVSPCISMHFYVSFYISIYFHASLQRFPCIFLYFGAKSWISLAAGLRAPLSFPPPEFHAKLHPSNSPSEPRPGRDRDRAWALPMQAICSLQDPWRFLFGGGDFHSRVLLAGRLGGS